MAKADRLLGKVFGLFLVRGQRRGNYILSNRVTVCMYLFEAQNREKSAFLSLDISSVETLIRLYLNEVIFWNSDKRIMQSLALSYRATVRENLSTKLTTCSSSL